MSYGPTLTQHTYAWVRNSSPFTGAVTSPIAFVVSQLPTPEATYIYCTVPPRLPLSSFPIHPGPRDAQRSEQSAPFQKASRMAVLLRPASIAGGRQVWPVPEEDEGAREAEAASQRLVEAVARGDAREAGEVLAAGRADVNYAGVVWLKARRVAEAEPREGAAAELRAVHEEIRADVSPLFLAAGNGDVTLVRALLVSHPAPPTLPRCSVFSRRAAFLRCFVSFGLQFDRVEGNSNPDSACDGTCISGCSCVRA
jgi:hypothetical protein